MHSMGSHVGRGRVGGEGMNFMHVEAHAVWRCSRVSGISECERLLENMVFIISAFSLPWLPCLHRLLGIMPAE